MAVHLKISCCCVKIWPSPRSIRDGIAELLQMNFFSQSCLNSKAQRGLMWVSMVKKDQSCSILWTTLWSPCLVPTSHLTGTELFSLPFQTHCGPKSALTKPVSKPEAPFQSMGMFGTSLQLVLEADGNEATVLCPVHRSLTLASSSQASSPCIPLFPWRWMPCSSSHPLMLNLHTNIIIVIPSGLYK